MVITVTEGGDNMSTNEEAPMSVSSTVYYRGVSVIITKRDPEAKIKPLIESQLEMIDWMLDEKKSLPSWNMETNKELHKEKNTAWINTPTDLGECPKCDAPMKLSKAGKPYCSKLCWKQG